MPVRKLGKPFVEPFLAINVDRTYHTKDIRPWPYLPAARIAGEGWHDRRWEDNIVILPGEPVGLVQQFGRSWIVPCIGPTAAGRIQYSALDVGLTLDITTGEPVDAANIGAPSDAGTMPATLPIGIAIEPIRANQVYTTNDQPGYAQYPDVWENYDPALKPVVMQMGYIEVPYIRFGANAMGDLDPGENVMVGVISGPLGAANRPRIIPANFVGTGNDFTAATIAVQLTDNADVAAGDTLTITSGTGDSVTITVVDAEPDITAGEFMAGVDAEETVANAVSALQTIMPSGMYSSIVISGVDDEIFTITAKALGPEGNFTYEVEEDAAGTWDETIADSANGAATINITGNVASPQNLAYKIGRVQVVFGHLGELEGNRGHGKDAFGAFAEPHLQKMVTTPGLDLAGRDSGGVPAHLRVLGNSSKGNRVPADWSEAGYVRLTINTTR